MLIATNKGGIESTTIAVVINVPSNCTELQCVPYIIFNGIIILVVILAFMSFHSYTVLDPSVVKDWSLVEEVENSILIK